VFRRGGALRASQRHGSHVRNVGSHESRALQVVRFPGLELWGQLAATQLVNNASGGFTPPCCTGVVNPAARLLEHLTTSASGGVYPRRAAPPG
jgi:hypothetical protein